ncbi:uncharacterized protein TNCV_2329251 [Trichonephila clavipes]|nr:uncharacterized protein TNCV_2329251 [Trichonephila clavipes]
MLLGCGSINSGICPRIGTSTLVTLAELRKKNILICRGTIYPQQEQSKSLDPLDATPPINSNILHPTHAHHNQKIIRLSIDSLALVRYQSRQQPSPFWRYSLELNTRIRPFGLPPPEHHWYQCSRPGGFLTHGFTRHDQTLLARFRERSGHIKTMKFSEGSLSYEMCMNCSSEPASPAQILECLELTKQDLSDDPLLVFDFFKVYDVT